MIAKAEVVEVDEGTHEPPPLSRKTVAGWMALFLILGLAIRMQPPFYYYTYNNDEFILMGIVNARSLSELMHFALYDSHPPLYYILAHYWSLISSSPPFMRSLELIMGTAPIPLYYFIGKRIGGPVMGLCCAGLVALSFGGIIQSYIMRQYGVLMLTLSVNFYYYIRWRAEDKTALLAGYVVTGWLVALSHFFSDFYFLSVVAFEAVSLYRNRDPLARQRLIRWLLANGCIFVLVVVLFYFWEPTLAYYKHQFPFSPVSAEQMVVSTLVSPFYAASYIYPSPYPLLPFMLFYIPFSMIGPARATLRPYIILGIIACAVSMAVYGFGFFEWLGTRHSLWMFPLLIVPAGGVLADILNRRLAVTGRLPVHAMLLLIGFAAVSDTGKRFMDEDYPSWQRGTLQAMSRVLETLGPRDVFITDKDGLNLLSNMQPYKTDEAFMNSDMPVLAPYKNTHILIGQDYFGTFSPLAVHDMLLKAEAAHLLDGIDRIVIVKLWNTWPFYPLVICPDLEKQILFPQGSGGYLSEGDFTVAAIAKEVLFRQVLSGDGDTQKCLNPAQGTIPEWYYLPRTAKRTTP